MPLVRLVRDRSYRGSGLAVFAAVIQLTRRLSGSYGALERVPVRMS